MSQFPTPIEIHDVIRERWSPRGFDRHRKVNPAHIHSALEAARWAPSSFNLQPWRFIVWNNHVDAESYERAYATIVARNQVWIGHAPVLIAVLADTRDTEGKLNGNNSASYDTGAAALSLTLQARALGLVTRQIGGFDRDTLRAAFDLPEHIRILSLIGLGYHSEQAEHLSEELRKREGAPRVRKPLEEIAYANGWAQSLFADALQTERG